jgi:Holliday junction resolvase-like predicted endonuclease
MKECVIEKQILDWLNQNGFMAWKPFDSVSTHRYAYQIAGVSDIIAVKQGVVYFIEVKNEKGKQSPAQKVFQKKLEEHGGTYVLTRSLVDLKRFLGLMNVLP